MSKVFQGKTAWFAQDVQTKYKTFWFHHGGRLETMLKADYIFATEFNPDIVLASGRSGDKYPVALFHPKYIEVAAREGNMNGVPIGRYLLMPVELIQRVQDSNKGFKSYLERLSE